MLDTKTEIMQILYARVHERCQKSVLRLHNQTFLHAIACEEVIGKPIILTEKKILWPLPALTGVPCTYPTSHHLLQVNQHRTTRVLFQHFHEYILSNIKQTTWRDHHPWPDQDASRDETSRNQRTKSHSRARVMTGETIQVLTKSRK